MITPGREGCPDRARSYARRLWHPNRGFRLARNGEAARLLGINPLWLHNSLAFYQRLREIWLVIQLVAHPTQASCYSEAQVGSCQEGRLT